MTQEFKATITEEEISDLPLNQYDGEVIMVDSPTKLDEALDYILKQPITGFDTETKPSFKKKVINKLSLVQIATSNKVFLIRIQHTGFSDKLIQYFEKQNSLKIGVALKDDLKALQKYKKFTPNGFVDLQQYVKQYGIENSGLKKITAIILQFRISKRQQTSNWDSEELTESQIRYAATDAWVCYEIFKRLNSNF